MEALREAFVASSGTSLAVGGLVIGLVFGFAVYRTNFCTMGALSDIVNFEDYRRFRAWLLAMATALVGAQVLQFAGAVDLSKSMYSSASLNWLGNVLGGLMFGFGMVFAGGCTSRNLVRAGGGDIRSLIVLVVVGIFAYMTIGGLFGPVRAELQEMSEIDLARLKLGSQGLGDIVSGATGLGQEISVWLMVALLAGGSLVYCLKDEAFRSSPVHIVSGIAVGLCVIAGWAVTGLSFDEFADRTQDPISLSYVRPSGDLLEYLMRFTAGMVPTFGVASVLGALAGAFLAAVSSRRFLLTTFADTGDTLRNLGGAALMGVGGVLALGCTIGQAVTGLSTLALGSLITFVMIVAGGILGLKTMERLAG
jgi:uncharacterized membrane protein YedE/YeeE